MKILVAIALLFTSCFAMSDPCLSIRDAYDQNYCFNKIFSQVDGDLNNTYQEITNLLNRGQKKTLQKIQEQWISDRNHFCTIKQEGKLFTDIKCIVDSTSAQLKFLQSALQSCKTEKCNIQEDMQPPENIPKGKYKATYYNENKYVASDIVDEISIHYIYSEFHEIPSEAFRATWETDITVESESADKILSVDISWSDISVFIDDEPYIKWSNNNKEATIRIPKGTHRIKIDYRNHWHTVGFTATFKTYPKLTWSDAQSKITPLINSRTKTIYVGAYEAKNIYNQIVIKIPKSNSPLILFFGSYDAVHWKIENPFKTTIHGIFFNSYGPGTTVITEDKNTVIFKLQGLPYAYEKFEGINSLLQSLTGIAPSYKYGEYALSNVDVPTL